MTPPDQSPRFGITTDSSIPWTMPQSVPQYAGYQNWMMAVSDANPSVSSQFITERPRSLPPWNGDQSPQQQHPFNPTSGGPSSSAFQSQSQFRSGFEADPDLRAYLPQNPSRPILPPQTAAADNPLRVRTAISDSPLTTSESSSSSSSTTPLPQSHRSGQHMNPTTISSAPPSSSGASRSISSSDSVDFLIGKDYILTLQHIKPYQDVLSFPFVTSFGKVLEGKFVELTLPSQEKLYSIQYVIQPLSSRNLQQFQYFQNSSILYEGSTLNVSLVSYYSL